MSKQNSVAKAIASIDGEIAVLQAVKIRLQQQQTKAPVRRPQAVTAAKDEKVG